MARAPPHGSRAGAAPPHGDNAVGVRVGLVVIRVVVVRTRCQIRKFFAMDATSVITYRNSAKSAKDYDEFTLQDLCYHVSSLERVQLD